MGSDVEVIALGIVVTFLGRPWRLGSVLMRLSVSELCGAGAGGGEMTLLRMVSKCVESVWRPGSMLMDGLSVLMYIASSMPLFIQSCSDERMVTSSLRKWCWWSLACCSMADLYLPRALDAVEVCSWKRADVVRSVSPTYLPGHGVLFAPAQGMW